MLPRVGESELRLLGQGQISYRLFSSTGQPSDDITVDIAQSDVSVSVSHEELQEQADESGLDDIDTLVATDVQGEARAGMVTRDEAGLFTIGTMEPISPAAQYVPLRFER